MWPARWWWLARSSADATWAGVAVLALVSSGLAYLLYFRLITRAGPANAIAMTFLIPGFAVLCRAQFLGEALTPAKALGCAVILLGTTLATGLVGPNTHPRGRIIGSKACMT